MVNDNTHVFLAHRILDHYKGEIKKILFAHMKEFYLGAIIYDTFKYSRGYVHFSRRLHGFHGEKTNDFVLQALEYTRQTQDKGSLACVFGILSHIAADITIHPAVYSKCQTQYKHFVMETNIDKKINHSFYAHELVYPALVNHLGLVEVFSKVLRMEHEKTTKLLRRLLWRQLKFGGMKRKKKWYFLAKLFMKKSPVLGLFYANSAHVEDFTEYTDPVSGLKVRKNLHELMDDAFRLACEMINAAYDFNQRKITINDLTHFISGESLITGKIGVGIEKIRRE